MLGPDKKGREYTMKTWEVCCEKTVLGGRCLFSKQLQFTREYAKVVVPGKVMEKKKWTS